jgi:SAM-dependent methyltransferase
LIRHASGLLYQEAHLELERTARQLQFWPGLLEEQPGATTSRRDARFTPPELARAMVQQALAILPPRQDQRPLVILDPACGSGIFLIEALKELTDLQNYRGTLSLVGYDNSEVACAITKYCLHRTLRDYQNVIPEPNIQVINCNAMQSDWNLSPDLLLMNPPFAAWNMMDTQDRADVRTVLGDLFFKHADKAMAFVWKAAQALRPGGVLATLLPAPLLETQAGLEWRRHLIETANLQIHLLGYFKGFGFFRGSTVEPAFVVLGRTAASPAPAPPPIQVVLASTGSEEKALRALRRSAHGATDSTGEQWEVFKLDDWRPTPASWMPRSRHSFATVSRLQSSGMPTVDKLFKIHLGIRPGNKRVFVVPAHFVESLPEAEKKYFKLAAGNATIRSGRLFPRQYVFFPYQDGRTIFDSETELQAAVPSYFRDYLSPQRTALENRTSRRERRWWELSEPRLSWQAEFDKPKIISAYFGDRGSFAYDVDGEYAVVQGFAWLWKGSGFDSTQLPWAYLALLNSQVFETILSNYCPRVRGGQFDLSVRFVRRVIIPDLSDDLVHSSDAIGELVGLGTAMARGRMPRIHSLNRAVNRVYGNSPPL